MAQVSVGRMPFMSPNVSKDSHSTDHNQWPGLILSSSTTGFLRKGRCSLYDTSTLSLLHDNSSLVDDPTIRQPGFDLPRCYWALLNRFRTNQSHCASCRKWGLAATDMCPCGKHQTMSHIVNSYPQSKLEEAAATALS